MKMKIKKIYNNNIALVINDREEERILIGKGIAFGLRKGDDISTEAADKEFALKGEAQNKFEKVIEETPIEYIMISEEIIEYIKENSDKKIDDTIYVTLTDHIANTIERIREGVDFDTTMLLNIKSLYREEYQLALHAVQMLQDAFNLRIDDSEANFITLHIVNAQLNSNMMQMYTITSIIEKISEIVKERFEIEIEENVNWDRFIVHCRFFVQRVLNQESLGDEIAPYILAHQNIHRMYQMQDACVETICTGLEKKYSYKINQDERMYLLIHLIRLTDKTSKTG